MQNAGLDVAQARLKIARRNINNLRYADDTTLIAEIKEEPKSPLMKVKAAAAAAKSLQLCPTLCNPIDVWQPTRLPRPWDSPGKNTGVGCHFLL